MAVVTGLLLAVAPAGAAALAAAPAGSDGYPRILQVRSDPGSRVSLDVVVPPLLSAQRLPPSAFAVTQHGRSSAVTSVAPVLPAGRPVVLVLDPAVPPAMLAAEQGAARELVFALPAQTRVGLVRGGPDPEELAQPGTDREATVRALVALRAQPMGAPVDAARSLELATSQLDAGTDGVVVLVDSRPTVVTVPYELSRAVLTARTTVYAVLLRPGPAGYLGGLPPLSGGLVLQGVTSGELLKAFDTVRAELFGRYRIGYLHAAGAAGPAQLVVAARGVRAATTFEVRPPATAAPARDRRRDRPVGLILAGLVALGVGAVLAWRLAGTPPAAGGPTGSG